MVDVYKISPTDNENISVNEDTFGSWSARTRATVCVLDKIPHCLFLLVIASAVNNIDIT